MTRARLHAAATPVLLHVLGFTLGLVFLSTGVASAQDITAAYPSFSAASASAFQINGSSSVQGGVLRLTPASGTQAGSAFWKSRVSLEDNRSFSTTFKFQTLNGSIPPADGLVFVLQPGTNTAFTSGGGLGYGGIPDSLGVEFDTWRNNEYGDPNANHVGIDLNGSVQSVAVATPSFTMSSGGVNRAWIDYDGVAKVLEVRVANSDTRPSSPLLSYSIDLAAYYGPDVYVGFTAATGGSWETHDILSWYFNNDYIATGIVPSSETYTMGVARVDASSAVSSLGGGKSSTVHFVAYDAVGNVLPNVTLTASADAGEVSPATVVTDSNGGADVTFTAPNADQTVRVAASASGGATGEVTIDATAQAPVISSDASSGWSVALLGAAGVAVLGVWHRRRGHVGEQA